MNKRAEALIKKFSMTMLPEEFTYLRELYKSDQKTADGLPTVTKHTVSTAGNRSAILSFTFSPAMRCGAFMKEIR